MDTGSAGCSRSVEQKLQDGPPSPSQLIQVALRYWWLLILGPIIAGTTAYLYGRAQSPVYEAAANILVQQISTVGASGEVDLDASRSLARAYADAVLADDVLREVGERLERTQDSGWLESLLSVEVPPGTRLLRITARDETAEASAAIANLVARVFIRQTEEGLLAQLARLRENAGSQGTTDAEALLAAQGGLSIAAAAVPPGSPVSPRPLRMALAGALLGFLGTSIAAYAIEIARVRPVDGSHRP